VDEGPTLTAPLTALKKNRSRTIFWRLSFSIAYKCPGYCDEIQSINAVFVTEVSNKLTV